MRPGRPSLVAFLAAATALAACGDPNPLPPAAFPNRVDTSVVYAVTGTEVWRAAGYAMAGRGPVRLDRSLNVDFSFDFRGAQAVLLPGALVGQPGTSRLDPGVLRTTTGFPDLTIAEVNGYVSADTVHVKEGDVFFVRGRIPASCFFGLPIYGKLGVILIDPEARAMRFEILANVNCGYRSLVPGIPSQ